MKYSAIHKQFIISQNEIEIATENLRYAMKKARKLAKKTLGKRNDKGQPLSDLDHLERAILDAAKSIGIDFGAEWGSEIDLSE